VVVMDEMSLVQEHNPYYRWSIKGKTPKVKFIRKRESAINFFGGLSFRDKRETVHLSEDKKSPDFIDFLEELRKKYLFEIEAKLKEHNAWLQTQEQYQGLILVVLDNASIHKSKETRNYLEKYHGIFELYPLPTYSPDANPQERIWKSLRSHLSKVAGKYTFNEMVDRACRFLLSQTFDYSFS
jgi:competence transcription factor ComK